jgi:hypothetical protein
MQRSGSFLLFVKHLTESRELLSREETLALVLAILLDMTAGVRVVVGPEVDSARLVASVSAVLAANSWARPGEAAVTSPVPDPSRTTT